MEPLQYEIDLRPGETLQLPQSLVDQIGPGQWRITIEPSDQSNTTSIRDHGGFLNSYAPEDEGLYDNYPAR